MRWILCLGLLAVGTSPEPKQFPAPKDQSGELIVTSGCIKSINLARTGTVHFILGDGGKLTGKFYFVGDITFEQNPRNAPGCDVHFGVGPREQ